VNVRNKRYRYLFLDLAQRSCCFQVLHSQTHELAAPPFKLMDLTHSGSNISRVCLGHRLYQNGVTSADEQGANPDDPGNAAFHG
jgi:hypothetical protein